MNWKLTSNVQLRILRKHEYDIAGSSDNSANIKYLKYFLKVLFCFSFPTVTFLNLSYQLLSCHIWLNQSHHLILPYKANHSITNVTRQDIFVSVVVLEVGGIFRKNTGPWISDLF